MSRGSESLFGSAAEIGRQIKTQIRDELRLVASVGVAPNKFVAKIASDLREAGRLCRRRAGPGAGVSRSAAGRTAVGRRQGHGQDVRADWALQTIGQLRQLSAKDAERPVSATRASTTGSWPTASTTAPSFPTAKPSRSRTRRRLPRTFRTMKCCRTGWWNSWIRSLGGLRGDDLKGRTVEIKVRFADFQTITRSLHIARSRRTSPANCGMLPRHSSRRRSPRDIHRSACWDSACMASAIRHGRPATRAVRRR